MGTLTDSQGAELFRHAQFQLQLGRWSEARSTLLQLATDSPHDNRYRALLAYARGHEASAAGNTDLARTEWRRALVLDPTLEAAEAALRDRRRRQSWVDRLLNR